MSLIYADTDRSVPTTAGLRRAEGGERPTSLRAGHRRVLVGVLCLLTAGAVVLYLVEMPAVDLNAMTGSGLISVLPVTTLCGMALLVVVYIGSLSLRQACVWLLCVQLLLLVLMLHGITLLLESEPRFAISWVHAGFVEFVDRTGTTAAGLDARWSWPGFFGLAAFWVGSGDLGALYPVMMLAPIVHNLLYLVALGLLMSCLKMSWQAKWLAAMFFCLLNWIGQDYFAPQGFALLLYLLLVAFLVKWFRVPEDAARDLPGPARAVRRLWRWAWGGAERGELPARATGSSERVVVLTVVVGLFATATVSHQLTPFAMIVATAGLVVARRCTLIGLPVLLGVVVLAWISYMTQEYWAGNLNDVVSGVGDVGGTVSSNIADRASLGDAAHQLVVRARVLTTLTVFLAAGVGLLRRRRHGIEDRVLLVLLAAPIGLAFMQSYGGEMALRIYLFALAPASALVALALFPRPEARPSVLARCAAGVCALGMLLTFFVTRYGNEAFERIPAGAVDAIGTIYEQTSHKVKFLYVTAVPDLNSTPFMPLGYRDVERVQWTNTMAPLDPTDVTEVLQALRDQGPGGYLVTTRSQEAFVMFGQGYPVGWNDEFRGTLASTPGVRVIVENPDATVYALDQPLGSTPEPLVPPPTGLQVWRTPWTPVGVGFLVLLLGVLGTREVWRIRLPSSEHRRLRALTFASIPLLIGFVVVVLERFVLLTS
ncbi:hypothetical protein MX572_10375 [Rhodococcus pyridinivorans]|uniref:hypothetical protein n=1 Tax=Rhodococcus pyridinivorans TaxID=103816 RepID=UPI0020C73F70|nr:hypothetical protein [Rhodococcus pyridinivorans]UTM39096.1 hypothetical protein MX572_10375 [Rhodococcus pyridinivorans]